jgi:hypothetical protein
MSETCWAPKTESIIKPKKQKPQGEQTNNPLDIQVGGEHYKTMKVQPVEYAHANGLPMIEGNVVKYVTRHRQKGKAQDIRKAIHFLELLLKLEYGE